MQIIDANYGSDCYRSTLALRERVLRVPLGLTLSTSDVSLDAQEKHFALMDGEAMLGCVSLRPLSSQSIKLRQMAVDDAYQGKGIGAALVRHAEKWAKAHGFTEMNMHARVTAQRFYEKLGYIVSGEVFEEVTVATVLMKKIL